MRKDMHKVHTTTGKRSSCTLDKGHLRRRQRQDIDEAPLQEPMHRNSEHYSERRYGPLRRLILSRVGQPWDAVFAEVCRATDARSHLQRQLRQAVQDLVMTDVRIVDGKPVDRRGIGIWSRWQVAWVHPETGILMRSEQRQRTVYKRPRLFERVDLNTHQKMVRIEGIWYMVSFADIPEVIEEPLQDIVLAHCAPGVTCLSGWLPAGPRNRNNSLFREWGTHIYAVTKRQANKREIKQLVPKAEDAVSL